MNAQPKPIVPADVAKALERLDHWRETRPKKGPLPKRFWRDACELARVHGINLIARTLRLNHTALKDRVEALPLPEGERLPARFVEVAVSTQTPPSECVVEMERPDGARMRVRFVGQTDLSSLSDAFWRYVK